MFSMKKIKTMKDNWITICKLYVDGDLVLTQENKSQEESRYIWLNSDEVESLRKLLNG